MEGFDKYMSLMISLHTMTKLQLEESTEGGNNCEQKQKSLVSLVQAVYHPSLLSLSSDFISHKLTKSSHPRKC